MPEIGSALSESNVSRGGSYLGGSTIIYARGGATGVVGSRPDLHERNSPAFPIKPTRRAPDQCIDPWVSRVELKKFVRKVRKTHVATEEAADAIRGFLHLSDQILRSNQSTWGEYEGVSAVKLSKELRKVWRDIHNSCDS